MTTLTERMRAEIAKMRQRIGTGGDPYEAAVERMRLRCAQLSDDLSAREKAREALGEDTRERENVDLDILRQGDLVQRLADGVSSAFVHYFRLRERLIAQRNQDPAALDRWRQSLVAATGLPTDVPLGKVLDELDAEPPYAELAELTSEFQKYDVPPIDPVTFVDVMMGKAGVLWPGVLDALIELNSGRYVEAVLTGGIGSGKTTLALYTTAYQLYLLSRMRDPHREFDLDPSSEILLVFQSITAHAAKVTDYLRFRDMVRGSSYFSREFPFDKSIESELRFPGRIVVRPVTGEDTAAIGENVMGGVLDELNFMQVVERSARAVDAGGIYDQAVQNYQAIVRRRKSRFMKRGKLPGVLCLVSSRRHPGQFTDAKEKEANSDPTIYIYDRRVWEVCPPGNFCGDTFRMFTGDLSRNPRILGDDEPVPAEAEHKILEVPVEYRTDFENDPIAALRDIAGISTYARHPFILDTEAVADCFGRVKSVLSAGSTDYTTPPLKIFPTRITNNEQPRFAHVDLARVSDNAGVAVGYVEKFIRVARGDDVGQEILPVIVFDLVLEVQPPTGGEINFAKIRTLFYKLRDLGMNLRWITYDSWQSTDSLQILHQKGFMTGEQSIDRTTKPYDMLKQAIYDRRLKLPEHKKAQEELLRLEFDARTGKIDHGARGSKDCADAIAGVVFGLTRRTEVWSRHGVPLTEIPGSLMEAFVAHGRATETTDERR